MVASMIVGGKYDEIKSALWYFEQAAKEKIDEFFGVTKKETKTEETDEIKSE